MKVVVNPELEKFYLAFDEWMPVVGHAIKVGKYNLCATPVKDEIIISEVTSGCKVKMIKMSIQVMAITMSKKDSLKWFREVGESIGRKIEQQGNFDEQIEQMKKVTFDKLGEMPSIEKVKVEAK